MRWSILYCIVDKNVDTDKIASVVEYNYKRIVLSYGPKRQFKVGIFVAVPVYPSISYLVD